MTGQLTESRSDRTGGGPRAGARGGRAIHLPDARAAAQESRSSSAASRSARPSAKRRCRAPVRARLRVYNFPVITGFNTDVKHRDRVFHIHTEDRGDPRPYIESFVYVGGEILGGKRTPYDGSLRTGGDDRVVREMMEQQHRTVIA